MPSATTATATAAGGAVGKKRSSFDPHGVLNALEVRIEPVRVGPLYTAGLMLVAAAMLLLPLIYIGLIVLAAYGVYYHAVNDVGILTGGGRHGGGEAKGRLIAYVGPLIAGVVLVLFMVKPLFARAVKGQRPYTLNRSKEPLLFSYIDRLCTIVGAPKPRQIDVDCQVNASASYRGGWWSMLSGQLVLTVGLPLIGGLNLRQFTGVLAHEFGHFSQGTAMRLTYVIRSVSGWFARVVYERDSWDQTLINACHSGVNYVTVVAFFIRGVVWLTRRILWLLMMVGHVISCFMLRQMEFDADRHEARVSGSKAFAQTAQRLVCLNLASNAALSSLSDSWRERRLCDDLSMLVGKYDRDMPEQVRTQITKIVHEAKAGIFSTHPADADRIRNVANESAEGVFQMENASSVLFADFPELAKDVTMLFYMQSLGDEVKPEHVISTQAMVDEGEARKAEYSASRRLFQDLLHPTRPVFPDQLPQIASESAAAEQLLELRGRAMPAMSEARDAVAQFDEIDRQMIRIVQLDAAKRVGARFAGEKMPGMPDDASGVTAAMRQSLNAKHAKLTASLAAACEASLRRMEIALAVQQLRARAASPVNEGELADDDAMEGLWRALMCLRCVPRSVEDLRQALCAMGETLSHLKPNNNSQRLIDAVLAQSRLVHKLLSDLHQATRGTAYPYASNEKGATIARFAMRTIPEANAVGQVFDAGRAAVEAMYDLYMRLMADLSARAEAIEQSFGLEPMPLPPEKKA